MSIRAIDLKLKPVSELSAGVELNAYTYTPDERRFSCMAESVYLDLEVGRCRFGTDMSPDEARVLANQLLQVADIADEHRATRLADEELQASFDEICEELRAADERGGGTGVYYVHPDVHYVPADQVANKVRELNAAGVKRFMVLAEPEERAA
jgi:hypothetical protein